MAAAQFEHADQARMALRTIVAEHGPEVLAQPTTLANLLADLLPESPRIARIFVAAAQDNIAGEMRQHTSDGMDGETASRLAASTFASVTMFSPDACVWVAGEFALALGLTVEPEISVLGTDPSPLPQGTDQDPGEAAQTEPGVPDWSDVSAWPDASGSWPDSRDPDADPVNQTQPDFSAISTNPQMRPDEDPEAHTPTPPGLPPGELSLADTSDLGPSVHEPSFAWPDPAPDVSDPLTPDPEPESAAETPATGGQPGEPTMPVWTAIVTADRGYFDDVVAEGDIEVASIQFPSAYSERSFPLVGTEIQIGRRSISRGLDPDIDLSQPPADPGVSHLHAVLVIQDDGSWAVVDPGSANGTQVNGDEITIGVPITLKDGDRITLGAWTALTIHATPPTP